MSAVLVQRLGETLLFDCGEGTQRQMMRYGTGFAVHDIFFTHMHADHLLGLPGLLRTMGLQGREEPMRLYCARGEKRIVDEAVHLGVERVPFPVSIHELRPGGAVQRDGYEIVAFRTRHGRHSLGYALVEHDRLGRFDPERARELGVPEGPLFGRLHRGEAVEVDGRTVGPDEVVGPARPGRRIVYSGDTRPIDATVEHAAHADLLIHEATFAEEEADRARETEHSTAREAAVVARDAGARRLVLTHISPRYGMDPSVLEQEARAVFPGAVVARDGMEIEIPYPDADAPG
ncbi:MAG: ribonuclease Z [Gemmatimonadetes bacterium]|nr:ribonuclease Z [Gemmatimonadota bacterium]NIQ59599.1 ribonuclease Z [Gemmatimonadota bacterium]NIU79805.1 ribonuclease Z [Gammaproteobacteria bacterium]NIX48309.1 ribonuclease Z [Gemmatimonadota bacterium]NIY12754.1 ribonuclease Z [Gemmatimonadota bacterium]